MHAPARRTFAVGAVGILLATGTGPANAATPPRSGCSAAQASALVRRFVQAFDRGDLSTLNQVWGSKLWFQWYGVTSDPGRRDQPEAGRRDTLLRYFATRHAAHEQLTLISLKLNGISNGNRNFEYRLLRGADDLLEGPVPYLGKGALSCVTGRLIVWTMGPDPTRP